jgi:hypothetical protein
MSLVFPERSESWAVRLTGQVPAFLDLFCLACIDRDTERFRCWGYYESTSETMSVWRTRYPGCGMFVVASVRVPVEQRDEKGATEALQKAKVMLDRSVWKNQEPGYVAFRNKLAEDLPREQQNRRGPGLPVERVDEAAFQNLLRTGRLA